MYPREVASSVVQTGTYSSWNKGDAAMELTMRELLESCGSTVFVSSPFPDHDRSLYGDATIRSPRRNLPLSAVLLALNWLWRVTGRRLRFLLGDEQGRRMAQASVIVDLSGDMLTEDSGPHVALSHFVPLMRAKALGRPYAIVAQSIGPFRLTFPMARWLLLGADLVTVRETETARYLGATLPTLAWEQTADLAFLMTPSDRTPIELPDGPLVAVSLSSLVRKAMADSGLDLLDEVASALGGLSSEGVTPVIVSHVTGPTPDKDDRILARELGQRLTCEHVVIEADLDPREIKSVIGRTELVIGARMHANIAGLSQGVPVVALAYSHKTVGIMADLGLGDLVLDCRGPVAAGALADIASAAWANRARHADTLRANLPATLDRSRRNLELLRPLLG